MHNIVALVEMLIAVSALSFLVPFAAWVHTHKYTHIYYLYIQFSWFYSVCLSLLFFYGQISLENHSKRHHDLWKPQEHLRRHREPVRPGHVVELLEYLLHSADSFAVAEHGPVANRRWLCAQIRRSQGEISAHLREARSTGMCLVLFVLTNKYI